MRKFLRTLSVLTLLFLSFQSKAQITNVNLTIDAGPYGPGSTIAATFALGTDCIGKTNIFELYLSDQNGNFNNQVKIGEYLGFYSTFVNGVIPSGTVAGTGYRLRVRSTSDNSYSIQSANFAITTGTASIAKLTSTISTQTISENPVTFGSCNSSAGTTYRFDNASSSGNVTATITNELTVGTPANLTFSAIGETRPFPSAPQAHFTIFVKSTMPDGTIGTQAYFLINNRAITAFSTTGGTTVCFPTGLFQYNVDVLTDNGIKVNFPGNTYRINWGDGKSDEYTFCDIQKNDGSVEHIFERSSCGLTYSTGTETTYNAFGVNVNVMSPYCGRVGAPLSTPAIVVTKPENRFTFPPIACLNDFVPFTNESIAGQKPNSNSASCTDNTVFYNWYVDGVLVAEDKPKSFTFLHQFTTKGIHTILLTSQSDGGCQADPVSRNICIQDPPQPSFTIPTNLLCLTPGTLIATSNSILDNTCPNTPTYLWAVTTEAGTPAAGVTYVGGTNANSINPQFKFSQVGIYNIRLTIASATCQATTAPQRVVVNTSPEAFLSPDISLCVRGDYSFDPNATVTRTTTSGTADPLASTYTWTVTGGAYSFAPSMGANTKYPIINFGEFATYTVTFTHTNNCNTVTRVQKITFSPAPIPSITATPPAICYNDNINLTGSIENNTPNATFQWVGAGTFTPTNNLTTIYTPTTAERMAGVANVRLVVTTGITGACSQVEAAAAITIFPENTTTNTAASRSQSICTGGSTSFNPESSVQGSTFRWTAVNTVGTATGFSPTGSGPITETIVNSSPTADAVIVYTITPEANGCDGVPFTFTVTITPKPVITTPELEKIICSNNTTAISVSSNIQTAFTWIATPSSGITGSISNPIQGTPTTELVINNTLINNTTTQGTVTYTITPYSSTGCEGAPITVTVKVDPTLTPAYAGPAENICATDTYTLNATPVIVGTGMWSIVSSQIVTFEDATLPTTKVSGLVAGQTYTLRWTVTGTGACPGSFSDVEITVNTPTNPGTTAGEALVCEASNNGSITLSGITGNVIRWESSVDGGITWQLAANTTTTTNYNYINLLVPTQFRAIVQNGGCPSLPSTATTITIAPATTIANAGTPQTLCAQRTVALKGNAFASGETGLWELVSGPGNIVIETPTAAETNVTGLVDGSDYVFRWTITGNSPCGPTTSTVNIRNNAPILQSIIGTGNVVCFGQTVTLDGNTPTGGEEGVYSYTWESKTGAGAWTVVSGAISEDLTVTLTTAGTISYRRTVTSGGCISISNEYLITVQEPITNNTISANQDICSGDPIAALTGSTPAGSNGIFRYQWQSRLATETVWTNIAGALSQNFSPSTLPISTILFRRIVTTDQCDNALQSISNEITVNVRQNAIAEFTYAAEKGCAPFTLNITATNDPARNATYTWFADNVQIGTGVTFPGYTITESNKSVEIKLVVTSAQNCRSAEFKYNFSTNQAVPATFTQDKTEGCGPLSVTFVNTSVLSAGATFTWDFGNGQTSTQTNPAPVTFDPEPTGRDTTYIVTLTSFTSCGSNTVTSTVFVKAKPVSVFSPNKTDGCSPMLVNFTNTSPGSTNRYFYDFGDGTPILETTDKSPVSHTYNTTTTQTFRATLTVVNECGTDVRAYNIRVAPQNITPELVVDANEKEGCAPLLVNFDNNSVGATRFTFDFGDGGTANTVTPGRVQHTFTRPGTYTVTMTAYNSCSEIATTETITVLPQPIADFNADITLGCAGLAVQFRNTTQDGFSYRWDFGDGTTSDEFEPIHTYDGEQEYYTVTLTATNTLGCSISMIKNQYIHIVLPPVARFNVNPSTVISIPNYTFRFEDESTNTPTIWAWDFGDGTTSSLQNPSHTYADTGSYVVRLRVSNQQGCFTSTFKTVQIVGVPGYLFVPNSFMPGGENPELREFKAKGSGIKTWKMSVFNKWGQTLWETTELNEGRPAKGWDGTFQGTVQPQGVFFWKIDIEFINGTEWKGMTYDSSAPKKTGVIHLIR